MVSFRRAVLALLTGVALTGAPADAAQPVYPEMHFEPVQTIRSGSKIVGYRLCAVGDASFLYVFGAWDYRMDGTRTSLSGATGPVVAERDSVTGSPFYRSCLTVYRLGYATGHVHATFSYDGVGGNVPFTIEHTFMWCEGCPNPTLLLDLDEGVGFEVDPI